MLRASARRAGLFLQPRQHIGGAFGALGATRPRRRDQVVNELVGRLDPESGDIKLDYRPVHEFTLTDDVQYIKPKARVY